MRSLLASPASLEIEFWMLRPDTLQPVRLRASRKEDSSQAGLTEIRVAPIGLAGLFWSCTYWFGADEDFRRYEGPSGPPGSALTRIEKVDSAD